jgi:hypothetical protein
VGVLAARCLALALVVTACGPSGPSDDVRAAACDYVQTAADRDFANRELAAYDRAAQGDFDEFVALGPERRTRFESLLENVRTIETYEPMRETASRTAAAIGAQIAAGAALIESPTDETLGTLSDAFDAFRVAEGPFLADLREHVPDPCE